MKLTRNWRSLWKSFSAQALMSIGAFQGMLAAFPASALEVRIPLTSYNVGQLLVALTIAAAVIGFIGRHIDQGLPKGDAS